MGKRSETIETECESILSRGGKCQIRQVSSGFSSMDDLMGSLFRLWIQESQGEGEEEVLGGSG